MTENNNAVLPVEKDVFAAPMAGRRDVREQLQAIPIPETSVPDDTPDDGREPIVFLDDIHVTFKTRTGSLLHPNKVKAVRGVTIKLMPGETIGIVGESGCGKSTTANV
ncbi:MAG: ATP-binding cassette domain-containing protein, partial [Eggerthellaceae bacterium]